MVPEMVGLRGCGHDLGSLSGLCDQNHSFCAVSVQECSLCGEWKVNRGRQ